MAPRTDQAIAEAAIAEIITVAESSNGSSGSAGRSWNRADLYDPWDQPAVRV